MPPMDEGRKRVVGIIAGILLSCNLDRADDLFGGPQGKPTNRPDDCCLDPAGRADHAEDRSDVPRVTIDGEDV
jgi:hypothetical protein